MADIAAAATAHRAIQSPARAATVDITVVARRHAIVRRLRTISRCLRTTEAAVTQRPLLMAVAATQLRRITVEAVVVAPTTVAAAAPAVVDRMVAAVDMVATVNRQLIKKAARQGGLIFCSVIFLARSRSGFPIFLLHSHNGDLREAFLECWRPQLR